MGTINSAFNIVTGALEADQAALAVVANNVANANTPGYTREIPNWQENAPIEVDGLSIGAGVSETGSTSARDRVLEQRIDQQQQLESASSARLTALNTMQALFTPDSGASSSTAGDIGSDITNFFASFSSLETNASSNTLRQGVLSSARMLAGDLSNAAASLYAQRSSLDQDAAAVVSQVNVLTSSIAKLNQEIESTSPNSDGGALEDQRQQDLNQLSQLVGIDQITTENNGLSVTTVSGQQLVGNGTSYPLTTGAINGVTHFFVGTTDITSQLTTGGGELGGYLTARDQDIPGLLASLDQLAYSISTSVNGLNNTGTDYDGATGTAQQPLYIFSQPTSVAGSAEDMSVVMSDPNQIAAASLGMGVGDGVNATAMANLGSQAIVSGQSPIDFYSSMVTMLGSNVSSVQADNTAQNASLTQLQTQESALSSVNLNDEAASMQQFERSYQAASQVFAILNTVMAAALNVGYQTAVS